MKMLGLMRERNLFLEKCRKIESMGEDLQWESSNDAEQALLNYIYEVLYQSQDNDDQDSYDF